ncbi:MAG: hypothetical protein CSA75_04045 [Sorangium cellulosum]|nr:MAG: hypothetical protein CSA75_04045 [Sorangium cellulosum]
MRSPLLLTVTFFAAFSGGFFGGSQPAIASAPSSLKLDASKLWLLPSTPRAADVESKATDEAMQWTPPVLHALTLLTVTRAAEAVIWPEPFARTEPSFWADQYREALTEPPLFDTDQRAFSWDGDAWNVNVIGHGLMGSELYLRARQCHFGWMGALAFTAASTATWEYVFEANGVRPSGQDLLFTPLSGLVFGEARFRLWLAAGGLRNRTFRTAVRVLADPFGEFERGIGLFDC